MSRSTNPPKGPGLDWVPPLDPATRTRAADQVFETLASAIITGKLIPNDPLPAERELAARFDISRVLVREAIHKLKELGLVRVRQGGQTIVLDPEESSDPRVTMLTYEYAAPKGAARRDMAQRQLVQGLILLTLAEPRITPETLTKLDKLVDDFATAGEDAAPAFIMNFWIELAKTTGNRILERETRFWFQLATRRSSGTPAAMLWDHQSRIANHRELITRLRNKTDAAEFFWQHIKTIIELS